MAAHPYDEEFGRALLGRDSARLDRLLMLEVVAVELARVGINEARRSLLTWIEPVSARSRGGWRLIGSAIGSYSFRGQLDRVMEADRAADKMLAIREGRRELRYNPITDRQRVCWTDETPKRELGVPHRTVQSWAGRCVDLGLITRTKGGPGRPAVSKPQFRRSSKLKQLLADGLAEELGL